LENVGFSLAGKMRLKPMAITTSGTMLEALEPLPCRYVIDKEARSLASSVICENAKSTDML